MGEGYGDVDHEVGEVTGGTIVKNNCARSECEEFVNGCGKNA